MRRGAGELHDNTESEYILAPMRNCRSILRLLPPVFGIISMVFSAVSCIYDNIVEPEEENRIVLQITTKADDHGHDAVHQGEDAFRENTINRVKLFFYPAGSDDNAAAIHCETIDNMDKIVGEGTVTLRLDVSMRRTLNLVKKDEWARVFAVVNLPGGVAIDPKASVNQIKNTVVTTNFRVDLPAVMPEFVMFGEGKIKVDDRKNASGQVQVKRTAAKIRIAMNIPDIEDYDPNPDREPFDGDLHTWTPNLDAVRVYITNGVSMAHIGGAQFDRDALEDADAYYKISPTESSSDGTGDYGTIARPVSRSSGIEDYPYWNDVPLYSYPHSWENTPYEDRQTYLVIQVPWSPVDLPDGTKVYKNFYYQVPVNLRGGSADEVGGDSWEIEDNTIESNMYYLIKLDIGMLGSYTPEEPYELKAEYYVVPWQPENIDARLEDSRYLVLEKDTWEMHNITDQTIPFYSSHETVIARVKLRFWNFNPVRNTYMDDGDSYVINYDGAPLRRTFTWVNRLVPDATTINTVYDYSRDDNGNPVWQTDINNENFTVTYHHELKRWTEYIEKNGQELPVFDAADVQAKVNNPSGQDRGGKYKVSGYYGQYNGAANPERNGTGTTLLKTTKDANGKEMDEWSIVNAEITIIHKDELEAGRLDNTRFQQTIYITQYPPMYIEAELSTAEELSDGTKKGSYVFVNNNHAAIDGNARWKTVTVAGTNSNPNMYVVTISQLDDTSLQIGDPRTLEVNNNLSSDASADKSSPWKTSTGSIFRVQDESTAHKYDWEHYEDPYTIDAPYSNGLSNYYPTDESTGFGSKENFVAPKLRIASSFGSVPGQFGREMARRRCAAYQEEGYPAGRWRLPTLGEIKFITQLSSSGRIPTLFTQWNAQAVYSGIPIVHSDGTVYYNYPHYWCAQGAAYIDGQNNGEVGLFPAKLYIDNGTGFYNVGSAYYPRWIKAPPVDARFDAAAVEGNAVQVAVRCVYDEWYWTDKCDKNVFTWGDRPKAGTQH